MADTVDWSQLPDVSLVEVYLQLKDTDKLNMACACKNWYRLFSSSVLWRERKVEFSSLAADRTAEKEIKFLNKHGQHLNKLKLGFGQPSFRSCAVISKAAENYLKRFSLRNDIHLKMIDLDNLRMEQYWHFILSRNRLITAICRMLRKQKFLETVNLSNARMRIFDACRILESLSKGPTANTIKNLYIEDFFENNVYPMRQLRYLHAISRFLCLENIHLNYKYLSEEVLLYFGRRLSASLQYLSIMIEGDIRGMELPSHCWEELKSRCAKLKVAIYLCTTIIRGNDLTTSFVRGIPLCELYLTSWARFDDTEERLGILLRHIGNTYRSTIGKCIYIVFEPTHIIFVILLTCIVAIRVNRTGELKPTLHMRYDSQHQVNTINFVAKFSQQGYVM